MTAERELDRLYAAVTQCEPRHRASFCATIEEHKRQTVTEIRNWISMNTDIIRISCVRHRETLNPQMAVT